ncbi:hemolysin BL-binding protein, partial [Dickeya undicola]
VNRFGNILAGNSLWIQRDAAGNASSSVLNSSGTIETQRGDITVHTGTLTNQREGLTVTESGSSVADMPSWAGSPSIRFTEGQLFSCTRGSDAAYCKFYDADKIGILYIPESSRVVNVTSNGSEAKLISGRDIQTNSVILKNDASIFNAGNNISINGEQLINSSYSAGELTKKLTYKLTQVVEAEQFDGRNRLFIYSLDSGPSTEYTPGQSYNATIQAGGAITASFSQNISNTGLQPGSGGFIPAIVTPTLSGVTALTPAGAQADRGLSGGSASPVSGSALSGAGASVALSGQAGGPGAGYSPVSRDSAAAAGSTVTPTGIPDLDTAGPVALGALPLSDLRAALAALGSPSLTDYPLPTG